MKNKLSVLVAAAVFSLAAAPAWAHLAFAAEFDAKKPVELKGVVTKVELINPTPRIHIDITDPDEEVTNWMIEANRRNVPAPS